MASSHQNSTHRRKLALIIANGDYSRRENTLTNSINNAKALRNLLKTINFNVTLHTNVTQEDEMTEKIKQFAKAIRKGDLVLFYFCGHGYQVNEKNYLIPVNDVDVGSDENCGDLANDFQRILGRLIDQNKPYATISILDCCRPYVLNSEATSRSRIKDNGLCKIEEPGETFIQFSCAADETANDDLFIEHLLKNITDKNVTVTHMFQRMADNVFLERYRRHHLFHMNGLSNDEHICLNQAMSRRNKKMTSSTQNLSNRRKLALIIGNDNYYRRENKLRNSVKNAKALSTLLKTINFDVTMYENVSQGDEMMEKVQDFESTIKDGDLVLFYFCGHGYQVNEKNYLIPVDDTRIDTDEDVAELGTDVERILKRLRENKPLCTIILILDCCRSYVLQGASTVTYNGLHEINIEGGTFIQFSCTANETANDDLFIEHLLKHIAEQNKTVTNMFQCISDDVCLERHRRHKLFHMDRLSKPEDIYLNQMISSLPDIPDNATWKCNAHTIAGGHDPGSTMDSLHCPKGLWMDSNHTMLVADSLNHRIMKYNRNTGGVQRVAGKNMQGYRPDLLDEPSNMIYDTASKSFIICDYHNRRVLRKSRTYTKAIIHNVDCFGLAMNDKGFIYISDTNKHEVRRYRPGKRSVKVVAGGNGQGSRLHQLNHPTYICIGDDESVYVSDSWNDRVVRWDKGAKQGIIVAGGNGKGKDLIQLNYPAGVLVDRLGAIYVADHWNHRVMRWRWDKDEPSADVIAGDHYVSGNHPNQMNGPEGLAFDQDGNLYVADSKNHRIQRFKIQTT